MKKVFIYSLAIAATCMIFQNCVAPQQPVSTKTAINNKDYNVSFLFEHDGCKVYRFTDGGENIYFTSCNGETSKVQTDTAGVKRMQTINKNRP